MDPLEYLSMLVSAYNPNQYEKLVERPLRQHLIFLGLVLVFSLAVFTAVTVPLTYHYISTIPERTAEVEQLKLDAEVSADHQVIVLDHPRVVLDTGENATRTASIMLTKQGVTYPKYGLFGTAEFNWSEVHNLKQQTPTRDRLLGGFIIFLLPSIIFWFFILSMFFIVLFFFLLTFVGWLIPRAFKHRITFRETCKLAIITMPSLLIFTFGLFPLGVTTIFWAGIGLTVVLFIIGIAVICEMDLPEEHTRRHGKV